MNLIQLQYTSENKDYENKIPDSQFLNEHCTIKPVPVGPQRMKNGPFCNLHKWYKESIDRIPTISVTIMLLDGLNFQFMTQYRFVSVGPNIPD